MACSMPADLLKVPLSLGSTADAAFEDVGIFHIHALQPRERHDVSNLPDNDAMRRLPSRPDTGEDAKAKMFFTKIYPKKNLSLVII